MEPWLEELAENPAVLEALKRIGEREQASAGDLCPRCVARERGRDDDWCNPCKVEAEEERRDSQLASKRRWWRKHGKKWREERK